MSKIIFKLGDKNDGVKQLQTDILTLGYKLPKYGADGDYGIETQAAIAALLKTDGAAVTQEQWFKILQAVWVKNGIVNFKPSEFVCRCGRCNGLPSKGVDIEFLKMLEAVRKAINGPLMLTTAAGKNGGYRCEYQNPRSGGATSSQHMISNPYWAADIYTNAVSRDELERVCLKVFANHGVGMNARMMVHVDKRPKRTRWSYA